MIELIFLKEMMLIRQANKESAIFVTIGIFSDKGFNFELHVCNGCHDISMLSMNLSNIAKHYLNIKGADYCCIISGINKSEAINLMQNIDLT